MLCSLPIAITGYAVIANTHIASVKYGMTFLMATGLYSSVPPVLGWLSNVRTTQVVEILPAGLVLDEVPLSLKNPQRIRMWLTTQCRTQPVTTSEPRQVLFSSP
jgi:hypothetical protein